MRETPSSCVALQVCRAVHEPAVAVRQLLAMLAAGVPAGPGSVAGLFHLLDGEGVRTPMCDFALGR